LFEITNFRQSLNCLRFKKNNYHYIAFLKSKQVSANPLLKDYPEINLDINLKIFKMGIYFFEGQQKIQTYEMGDYGVFFRDFYSELKKTKDISHMLTDHIYELMQEDKLRGLTN
jgi:hypothetical protein